jgi:hypothetical protein
MRLFEFGFETLFGFGEVPDSIPLRMLGLDEMPTSRAVLMTAFRSKVMAVHPDLAGYTLPGIREAAEAIVSSEADVQELVWARDVLARKLRYESPGPPPKTAEEAAFEAARKRHEEARIADRPKPTPEPITVTDPQARPNARRKRARRPVTRGCVGCRKSFVPDEEIWRIRDYWHGVVKRNYCATCGEKQARYSRRYRWGTGMWRGSCERCGRSLVLVDHTKQWDFCSCEEPDFLPVPVAWSAELEDRCARCNHWRFKPENWWETYSCGSACTKALNRARTRDDRGPTKHECDWCGAKFETRREAHYCSSKCRQAAYRERRSAR